MKPGEFFVLGDNRCAARDSRHFGPVDFDLITGRVVAFHGLEAYYSEAYQFGTVLTAPTR